MHGLASCNATAIVAAAKAATAYCLPTIALLGVTTPCEAKNADQEGGNLCTYLTNKRSSAAYCLKHS